MTPRDALRHLWHGPRERLLQKSWHVIGGRFRESRERRRDAETSSFDMGEAPTSLMPLLREVPLAAVRVKRDTILAVGTLHLDHRFDLLGSGWTQVRHGMKCRGLEGNRYGPHVGVDADAEGRWLRGRVAPPNLDEARRRWSGVGAGYRPIDWHLDFKSGHRWAERTWYRDIRWGQPPGSDIKVPWELGRMQHLPMLAWCYALDAGDGRNRFLDEFQNQVLDFSSTNPPRWGVNWASSMDVGLRAASWLLAYDLLRGAGAEFHASFEATFARSLYEHGLHLRYHPDWAPDYRGNHYLVGLAGLLFVAAHLPGDDRAREWKAWATAEFSKELDTQFLPDGSYFEGSTAYHLLASQAAAYSLALLHRAGQASPGTAPLAHCLRKASRFLRFATRPDGALLQVGDNDSGRFLKPLPSYHRTTTAEARQRYENLPGVQDLSDDAPYWREDALDPQPVQAALDALFDEPAAGASVEGRLISLFGEGERRLADGAAAGTPPVEVGTQTDWDRLEAGWLERPPAERRRLEIPSTAPTLRAGLSLDAFPDFGLWFFRSPQLWLAIRCGPIGQRGRGGHAHNDQLSFELLLGGSPVIVDPGSYLYTPSPRRRDEYRSVRAHFAPQRGDEEPGRLDLGPFRLGDQARARCLYFGPRGFIGEHRGFGERTYRRVEVLEDRVVVTDVGSGLTSFGGVEPGGVVPGPAAPAFSPGYGWRVRRE